MEDKTKNGRTLVYNCVDKEYAHWIPLYCLGMLYHNTDIDIEIGIEGALNNDEYEAIVYLQNRFPNSKIKINEYAFVRESYFALIDGIKCRFGTTRFITTPTIKNEYVYIGDVDVICLERNIFDRHVEFMKKENMCYSNIVRPNTSKLSGLHFSIYDCYYPIPSLEGIDMMKNDEEILMDLVIRKGITINYSANWRPLHGVHFSKNRPIIKGTTELPGWGIKPYQNKIPGWGADSYKASWDEFTHTEEYSFIISKSNRYINEMVDRIDKYFFPERYSEANPIFIDSEHSNWFHQTEYSYKDGAHVLINNSPTLYSAFPHLEDGGVYSEDFILPICFEFDITDMDTDKLLIQIYPDSLNTVDITPFVSKGSHVSVNVYSIGIEGFVDGELAFIKSYPKMPIDTCRIGLQLTKGKISFSNFIVRPY